MSTSPSQNRSDTVVGQPLADQRLSIDGNAQISGGQFGQAGDDLTQIQGEVVNVNIYDAQQVAQLVDRYGSTPRKTPISQKEYRDRKVLLNKVKNFWVEDVLDRSLHNRALVTLGLEERFDQVKRPITGIPGFKQGDKKAFPKGTSLEKVFDDMGEGSTLLLLGEPGSGKTTYLLNLLKVLVSRVEQDLSQPIPVVFNLSSWATKRKSIEAWIVDELFSKYQVSVPLAQTWVKHQNLRFLLDGLDEVPCRHREDCVRAINQFAQAYGHTELVICSRLQDYQSLSIKLRLQGAIYLQPLMPNQIEAYLSQAGETLVGLRTLLQQDAELREMARFPLTLSVMSLAYQGVTLDALQQNGTVEEKQAHLLTAYISRMLALKGNAEDYSDPMLFKTLSWLAQKMIQTSKTVFLLEELQPYWLENRLQRKLYDIGIRFLSILTMAVPHLSLLAGHGEDKATFDFQNMLPAAGLALVGCILYGLLAGLSASWVTGWRARVLNGVLLGGILGPLFEIAYAPNTGIAYAVIYFVVGVFICGFFCQDDIEPIEMSKLSVKRIAQSSILGLIVGLALLLGSPISPVASLIFGLAVTLLFGFKKVNNVDNFTIPNQGIWKTSANAGTISLTIGLMVGLAQGFAVNTTSGIVDGLIFGIAAALVGAQGSGIVCIKHFVLRAILWQTHDIPWNTARFLNYASRCVLLQKVGGGYMFVHRSLLEHFARYRTGQSACDTE